MAYETGVATDYRDLLGKLRDFLTTNTALVAAGQQWSVVGGAASGTPAVGGYVSLKGVGLAGTDEIFMSIQCRENATNNMYNLRLFGHISYDPSNPSPTQPGSSKGVDILLGNTNITYWVVANGRRFILITRFNSRYDWMYGGFILPYHLPDEWSYPLFVGGSCLPTDLPASDNSANHAAFYNGYATSSDIDSNCPAFLWCPSNNWRPVRNGAGVQAPPSSTAQQGLMSRQWGFWTNHILRRAMDGTPWFAVGEIVAIGDFDSANNGANAGQSITICPDGGTMYGAYDGLYYTPAFGATAEQTAVQGSDTYMMFPNVARTSDGQFAAIKLG